MNAVERLIQKLRLAAHPDEDWSRLEDADLEHAAAEIERLQAALQKLRVMLKYGEAIAIIEAALAGKGET